MDSRISFDAWLAETPFITDADSIYKRFSKIFTLEECLATLDPESAPLAYFCTACDPITFSLEGLPHRWIPIDFLYTLKRTTAHKKAVDRAVRSFPEHLHSNSKVERDIDLAIFLTYTDVEEAGEDDTTLSSPSFTAFLDEEPVETALPLEDKKEQSQALILHPSSSA